LICCDWRSVVRQCVGAVEAYQKKYGKDLVTEIDRTFHAFRIKPQEAPHRTCEHLLSLPIGINGSSDYKLALKQLLTDRATNTAEALFEAYEGVGTHI